MDAGSIQLITAGIGIAGTLLAASITQLLGRRNERDRQDREDRQRWLQDRFRVCREIVATAVQAERRLYDVASFIPESDDAYQKMRAAGYTSILVAFDNPEPLLRESGDEEIVRETLGEVIESLEGLDLLQAELALLEEGELVREAEELIGAIWNVVGSMEALGPASDAFATYDECHRKRLEFQSSARTKLGVVAPVLDERSRRSVSNRRKKSITLPSLDQSDLPIARAQSVRTQGRGSGRSNTCCLAWPGVACRRKGHIHVSRDG